MWFFQTYLWFSYSLVPDIRACSLSLFGKKNNHTSTFSCNKRKILPYSFIDLLRKLSNRVAFVPPYSFILVWSFITDFRVDILIRYQLSKVNIDYFRVTGPVVILFNWTCATNWQLLCWRTLPELNWMTPEPPWLNARTRKANLDRRRMILPTEVILYLFSILWL